MLKKLFETLNPICKIFLVIVKKNLGARRIFVHEIFSLNKLTGFLFHS